jgi:Ca2+-binding RTX toxin-like protein
VLDGGPGNDIILGGGSQDRLSGGDGDDILYGGASANTYDLYDCGAGFDTVYVDPAELLALPTLLRVITGAGSCERTLLADPSIDDPRFDGLRGAPQLGKLAGGAPGAAILEAIAVQSENETIHGTAGDDTLHGGLLADSINGQDGNDTLRGGDGNDDIRGDDGNDALSGDGGNDALFGEGGDDVIEGGAGGDELEGGRGSDTLRGDDGDDTLNGGFDADRLFGGAGDDELNGVDGAADQITCGAGFDRVTIDRLDRLMDRRACEVVE